MAQVLWICGAHTVRKRNMFRLRAVYVATKLLICLPESILYRGGFTLSFEP